MAGIDSDSIADAIQDEVRAEVCGGEDAFVSAMSEMLQNLHNSRFLTQAKPFLEKCASEKGYIDALREYWAGRECPKADLPDNKQLIDILSESL